MEKKLLRLYCDSFFFFRSEKAPSKRRECICRPLKRARFFHSISQRINYAEKTEGTIKIVICTALTYALYVKTIYRVLLLLTLLAYVTFFIPISKARGNFVAFAYFLLLLIFSMIIPE